MNIDINTRFITLLGTPLSQSFSARMQNAGYDAAGLNMRYFYTECDNEHLGDIVNGLRYMPSIAGFAVTKPNKVKVLEYLDELDPLCEKMQACNTVKRTEDNKLIGYNTDGVGFIKSLEEETDLQVQGLTCYCIGSGGAGRAICSVLAFHGAGKIYISDKDEGSARFLVEDINKNFAPVAEFVPFNDYACLESCALVVNATGMGMGKTMGLSPIPKSVLKPSMLCYDACYNPAKTQFLLDAEELGCKILNGLGMCLYQGVAQIEIWTGKEAPVEAMRRELLEITK